ncbi:MAG: DUF4349 domain-containing protein [Bacteroidales bacterium]|nr:DUF4349 domain-containing protein [Bacteroidales bacterium]
MRKSFPPIILLLFFAFVGCSSNSDYYAEKDSMTAAKSAANDAYIEESVDEAGNPSSEYSEDIPEPEAKVIKTGNVKIEVEDYTAALKKIKATIAKYHGTIMNENESSYSYGIENNLTIRMKSNLFDTLLNQITDGQKVVSKDISAQDVTEEFVDIQTRLKSKKGVRDRYSELLKQAKTINEIVTVEEQLRRIQEEIEAKEGRLKYLTNRTQFSTINLTIDQYDSNLYEPGFFSKTGEALGGGWDGFKWFIIGMLYVWPFWLIVAAFLIWLRYYLKKRKARKSQ